MSCVLHLRIPMVRAGLFSENWPTPTALEAARRTIYKVYGLRLVMTKGSVEQKIQWIYSCDERNHSQGGSSKGASPESGMLISCH